MSMLTVTEIKIQESPKLRALNAEKGITPEDFTSDRILLSSEVHGAIHAKMTEALSGYIDQICDPESYEDDVSAVDFDHVRTSLLNNIEKFKMDAGGGYTDSHKATCLANGVCEAIDFVKPENRGGGDTPAKSSAKGGSLAL